MVENQLQNGVWSRREHGRFSKIIKKTCSIEGDYLWLVKGKGKFV